MLSIYFVILFLVAQCSCKTVENKKTYTDYDEEYGKSWMYFPDGYGKPRKISLNETPRGRIFASSVEYVRENIHFELFSSGKNSREPKEIDMGTHNESDFADLSRDFNPAWPTKILIHGWMSSMNTFAIDMKDAYLAIGKYNIIAVSWSEVAGSRNYFRSATDTKAVGQLTAEMIDLLHTERNADYDTIHILGHSLGAHVSGYAGANTQHGKVSRITGFDPARPYFEGFSTDSHLDPSDAQFVDVIHTSAGWLGFYSPLGHIDFYPNTGYPPQPGCPISPFEFGEACSHGRSYEYFRESLDSESKGFYGYECDSSYNFRRGKCVNHPIIMGEDTPHDSRGVYYLKTSGEKPFGLGDYVGNKVD